MGRPQPIHESVKSSYKTGEFDRRKERNKQKQLDRKRRNENAHTRLVPDAQTMPISRHQQLIERQNAYRRKATAGKKKLERIPFVNLSGHSKKRYIKALMKGGMIASSLSIPVIFQIFIALLTLFLWGVGTKLYWAKKLLPVEELYAFCWVVLILLGILFMGYAAIMFTISRVNIFKPSLIVGFAVCLAGHWAPVLFVFPWVYVWIVLVIQSQK